MIEPKNMNMIKVKKSINKFYINSPNMSTLNNIQKSIINNIQEFTDYLRLYRLNQGFYLFVYP